MKKLVLLLIFALVLSLLIFGCKSVSNTVLAKPNIILIVVDTLRADRVGALGNNDNLTPNIDALAKDGVVFTRCFSTAPWTVPSMASLMTGLFSARHGVEHGLVSKDNKATQQQLSLDYRTLAERLKEVGYTNHGIVANAHLVPEFGFAQGFDDYKVKSWAIGNFINKTAGSQALALKGKQPYFLFAHYFDPHEPYIYRKWIEMDYPKGYGPKELIKLSDIKLNNLIKEKNLALDSDKIIALQALYNGEIKYTDQLIGKLLKTLGVTDNDLIIIISDHGEAFLEHDNLGHGLTVYSEETHIPCIIRFPNKTFAGQVLDAKISLVDMIPTIFGAIGAQLGEKLDGVDLFDCLTNKVFYDRPLFIDLNRPGQRMNSVILRDWKFNIDHLKEARALFDIRHDPRETANIIVKNPKIAGRLEKDILERLELGPMHKGPVISLDNYSDQDLDKFKALGYIN